MFTTLLLLATAAFSLTCAASPLTAEPQVNLGYATYEGARLPNGISQFLGMRYAAPPVGERRFKLPEHPLNETGIVGAKEHGALCYPVQTSNASNSSTNTSEDCLFIDVYIPSNATRKAGPGLPVLLWIQGGGFVQLINPNYNGTGLIEASKGHLIVVTFNYRVGPYGFLASDELRREGNLNMGLHDQRTAIRWVQDHISKFGGDPKQLSLFGTSVGAGSVILQHLAYGGNPPPEAAIEWKAGMAEAFFLPSTYEVEDLQFQYQQLLNATSCSTLDCLRGLSSEAIQAANVARPFQGQQQAPLFSYGPAIDGKLFTDRPLAMLEQGKFVKNKPLIIGSSHSEGTIFLPQANTTRDIDEFMTTQFPDLTQADLAKANQLYSTVPQTYPGVTAHESPLFYRAVEIYGDSSFNCPTITTANAFAKAGIDVYLFRDHILDPVELAAGFIVPHTWMVQAIWGPQYVTQAAQLPGADSYEAGGVNAAAVPEVQSYWTSFALTQSDPNAMKLASTPVWDRYRDADRLKIQTNSTGMERISQIELDRCAFWQSVAPRLHH